MKTLKFDHDQAQAIFAGQKNSTWRLYDDKDLSVSDEIKVIDKVEPKRPESWQIIGQARVIEVIEKLLGAVTAEDLQAPPPFMSKEEVLETYKGYYGHRVNFETPVKI